MHPHIVMVRLKNGAPDLTEDPAPLLPPALIRCEQLWTGRGRRRSWPRDQWQFVRATIEPLLYARIEPEDVHFANGLLNRTGAIEARSIALSSVSFEDGRLPTISAYAQFEMTFDRHSGPRPSFMTGRSRRIGWIGPCTSDFDLRMAASGMRPTITRASISRFSRRSPSRAQGTHPVRSVSTRPGMPWPYRPHRSRRF